MSENNNPVVPSAITWIRVMKVGRLLVATLSGKTPLIVRDTPFNMALLTYIHAYSTLGAKSYLTNTTPSEEEIQFCEAKGEDLRIFDCTGYPYFGRLRLFELYHRDAKDDGKVLDFVALMIDHYENVRVKYRFGTSMNDPLFGKAALEEYSEFPDSL